MDLEQGRIIVLFFTPTPAQVELRSRTPTDLAPWDMFFNQDLELQTNKVSLLLVVFRHLVWAPDIRTIMLGLLAAHLRTVDLVIMCHEICNRELMTSVQITSKPDTTYLIRCLG